MERKIVKHGPSTMMISLPAKWVRKKNLKKGMELDVEEKNNNLIISIDKSKHKSETTINITSKEESAIRTILSNAYRLGYDKITVNFDDKSILKIVSDNTDSTLLGFEITDKSDKSCIIESITEPSLDQYNNIFSKIFMNIEDLFSIAKNLLDGNKEEYENINKKILQLDNFCKRVVVKSSNFENNFIYWSFHSTIIHASRELYHLFNYLSKNKIKDSETEKKLVDKIHNLFIIIKESYDEKNLEKLEKIHNLEKDITYNFGYKALNKSKNPIVTHHLLIIGFFDNNK